MKEPIILKKDKLLNFVKNHIPENPIIVEAGAFNGADTKRLHTCWPAASIHAFEPVPEIFALLEQNTHNLQTIKCYQIALSDKTGHATFHLSENPALPDKPFPAGSLHAPKERLAWSNAVYKKTITVPTITLDAWAQQHTINHIDFLWLDLQGHALAVLKAAPHILARTKVIYIEVEFIQAYCDTPLYEEVKTWLESHGFTLIAKDFTEQTSWFFGNALFIQNYTD